jgi:5-methyltetrahydrofolate--homocysteine methyltransferase
MNGRQSDESSPPTLKWLLSQRVVVLDGAMGTQLQRLRLSEADWRGDRFRHHEHDLLGDYDALSLTRPDLVARVHSEYLASGSDIVQTNTFGGTAIAQAGYGLASMVYELNLAAARLAKSACAAWTARTPDRPRFVAGTIGPTNRSVSAALLDASASRGITFDRLKDAYREQVRGLMDGGCDLLLVETVWDIANAGAALGAIGEVCLAQGRQIPVMLSATVSESGGRTLAGQTLADFWTAVADAKPLSIGLNCSPGVRAVQPYLEELAGRADCCISIHPSAGLPDARGEYRVRPADFADALRDLASSRLVNIVGGCCGTTPEHVAAIVEAVRNMPPRATRYSGHPS